MLNIYFTVLEKIAAMFIFIAVGFFLGKKKLLPQAGTKVLSVLLVNLFLPALIFENLIANFSVGNIKNYLLYFLFGTGLLAVTFILAIALSHIFSKEKNMRKILMYVFTIPNTGYFGTPITVAVLGGEMLTNMIIFLLPYTVATYSLGIYLLRPEAKESVFSIKTVAKTMFSPSFIATILGIALAVAGIKMPAFISNTLNNAADCMSPSAMLLTGLVLSKFPFKKLFTSLQAYVYSFIRLAGLPLLFGGILFLAGERGIFLILSMLTLAMPIGLNTVIFPEADGADSGNMARICFISYLAAIFTIPLLLSIILNI